jgi:hypothetical protein
MVPMFDGCAHDRELFELRSGSLKSGERERLTEFWDTRCQVPTGLPVTKPKNTLEESR